MKFPVVQFSDCILCAHPIFPVATSPHPVGCSQLTSKVPRSLNTQATGTLHSHNTYYLSILLLFHSYFSYSFRILSELNWIPQIFLFNFYTVFQFMSKSQFMF